MGTRRDPDPAPSVEGPRSRWPASPSPDSRPAARLPVWERSLVLGPADAWLHRPPAPDRCRRRPAPPPADPRAHRAGPRRAARLLDHGVLRGLWALRRAERCGWGDALRALAIWFA